MEKNCKIIQDLLPTYLEDLTNPETTQFIEEHLATCKECQVVLESMKTGGSEEENAEKEVDYLKKYNHRLKIFKSIVLMVVLIFMVHVVRNMIIINTLQNRRKNYDINNHNNYSLKVHNYLGNQLVHTEFYKKDDKTLQITDSVGNHKDFLYTVGENATYYTENSGTKSVENLKAGEIILMDSPQYFIHENFVEYLWMSICTSIRSDMCNNIECYRITNIPQSNTNWAMDVAYIEKETGLTIRLIGDVNDEEISRVVDYEQCFDDVSDDVFIQPDISEYTEITGMITWN